MIKAGRHTPEYIHILTWVLYTQACALAYTCIPPHIHMHIYPTHTHHQCTYTSHIYHIYAHIPHFSHTHTKHITHAILNLKEFLKLQDRFTNTFIEVTAPWSITGFEGFKLFLSKSHLTPTEHHTLVTGVKPPKACTFTYLLADY